MSKAASNSKSSRMVGKGTPWRAFEMLSSKTVGDQQVPDKVQIQMLYTDPDIKGKGKIIRSSEKNSMTVALELATAWLDRGK